jgi:tetratricopeptide (TPR) repeat protein
VGSLRVISRTSVMQFKGTTKAMPQIARELAVDAVVEGSVQRAGSQVRITAQLIRGDTDHHIWADSYERDLRDVLALQSEVARAIAREVAATLTPAEQKRLVRTTPVDPAAYEIYLRGLQRRYRGTQADMLEALALFEQALGVDPSFALAHQRVCEARYVLGFTGWGAMAPRQAIPKARGSCLEALRLDPSLGFTHALLGSIRFYYDWDREAAEAAFTLSVQASPSDAPVMQRHAWFLSNRGRHSEAIALSRRAQALDPLSLIVATQHGWLLYWARQYDPAIEQFRRVLEERPTFPCPISCSLSSRHRRAHTRRPWSSWSAQSTWQAGRARRWPSSRTSTASRVAETRRSGFCRSRRRSARVRGLVLDRPGTTASDRRTRPWPAWRPHSSSARPCPSSRWSPAGTA